jgi:hypothetical protein
MIPPKVRGHRNAQLLAQAAAHLGNVVERIIQSSQGATGCRQQAFSFRTQTQAPGGAYEQYRTQIGFQPFQAGTGYCRRQIERVGRCREAPAVGSQHEDAEILQISDFQFSIKSVSSWR